ncbi:M16 family metallopeptidase [Arthrospiribacter ruber]|uniref:Insulinase family protein n=1 Tax=Arthrospiribacter ruber TaxID=2487934 RepID=A0A951IVH9_9BACT|nr:pitrilysin family protein [Arthrospiribacter ruber]MBW3466298.1 insulinase family protein [Arthrospiribacter ruber]
MSVDRTTAPAFQIPEQISFPSPSKRTLQNGVHLYFMSTPEISAVKLEINADSNRVTGLEEKKLVASFALHLLTEGTHTKNSDELDAFFDTFASEVEVISNFEHNGIGLLTTKKHFLKVLPVFRELMTEAVFPEKELAKRKSQKALSISIQREQNGNRASHLFRQQLFGASHPFGQISDEKDVAAIEKSDLEEFYKEKLWANPEVFLAGNLSDDEVEQVCQLLGTLPVINTLSGHTHFENISKSRLEERKESSLQSSLRIGCHLIPKTHPDYFGLWVFNVFLGGYFGSRLIKNIREEKGHTYGIYSSIGSLRNADYWVVMADVIKEHSEAVIEEIYLEIEKLALEPIPEEEIEIVRNYLIGNLLSNFSSSFDLISRFKSIHQAGLDFSFYEKQLDYIKTFKPEEIQAIGKKYLQRSNMVEVIVG